MCHLEGSRIQVRIPQKVKQPEKPDTPWGVGDQDQFQDQCSALVSEVKARPVSSEQRTEQA